MTLYTLLIIVHIVGTILGVGGATMIEVALNKALKDGSMSPDEKGILYPTYTVVRVGLVLTVLSGFGFLIFYWVQGFTDIFKDAVLWAKLSAVMIIVVNAILLQKHKISLYWGSALSFVSWWMATILGIFLSNTIHYSFVSIMMVYAVALVVGAYLLHAIRMRIAGTKA